MTDKEIATNAIMMLARSSGQMEEEAELLREYIVRSEKEGKQMALMFFVQKAVVLDSLLKIYKEIQSSIGPSMVEKFIDTTAIEIIKESIARMEHKKSA